MEVLSYSAATTSRLSFMIARKPPLLKRLGMKPTNGGGARRRLNFGPAAPANCAREANEAFLQQLMSGMAQEYRQKWEFDFEQGAPLPSSSASRFHYKAAEVDATPSLYRPAEIVASPAGSEESSSSDAENYPLAPVNLNRLANRAAAASSDDAGLIMPSDFLSICESPKKMMLKKPNLTRAYTTPKKSAAGRQTELDDFMPRRKRASVIPAEKQTPSASSPYKASPAKSSRRSVRMSPYSIRRHSMAI